MPPADPEVPMLATLLAAILATTAHAQDDIDDLDDEIDLDDAPKPAPPEPDEPEPPADEDEEDDGLEDFRDSEDGDDLLEDEPVRPDSGDTEQIYRAALARLSKFDADEELSGWEEYLGKYPNSAYRARIETRMEELGDALYGSGNRPPTEGPVVDALDREISFAHGMQLENLNPRTRLQVGFEWGLPDYVNLIADYEHQIVRNFSIHGGVKRRYLGWNVEAGVRWALVKSARTNTIVSLIGDLRLNTNPAYPGFRPQLAVGKRFGKVDAQIQGGADLTYRSWTAADGVSTASGVEPTIVGGLNLYYAASDRVGAFVETSSYMKSVSADEAFQGGMFRFNVLSFGLKFFPGKSVDRNQEVNFGATVPYTQQWWQFHYGSVMGQYNYYL